MRVFTARRISDLYAATPLSRTATSTATAIINTCSVRMAFVKSNAKVDTAKLSLYTTDNPNFLEQTLPEDVRIQHDDAVRMGATTYIDRESGYTVFCRNAHVNKGKCCGSGCRHCPYGWMNVPPHRRPREPPGATPMAPVPLLDVEDVGRSTPATPATPAETAAPAAVKKSRVYTRTGDKGKSSLCTGERRAKTDIIFDTLGTVDELSSCIGVAKEYLRIQQREQLAAPKETGEDSDGEVVEVSTAQVHDVINVYTLEHIQQLLMDVGTIVATPVASERCTDRAREKVAMYSPEEWIKDLERQIDQADALLPPITVFILPGGGLASAHLHLARTTCRRAERCMLLVQDEQGDEYDELLTMACKFVNRLSDFLFVAARTVALHADVHRSAPNGGKQ